MTTLVNPAFSEGVGLISVIFPPSLWDAVLISYLGRWSGAAFSSFLPLGLPQCHNSYLTCQGLKVGVALISIYVYFNYTFRDQGNDHEEGPQTQWTLCELDLDQNSVYFLVLISS